LPRNPASFRRIKGDQTKRASRNRPSKYAIVRFIPSRNPKKGSHPDAARARALSGCPVRGIVQEQRLEHTPGLPNSTFQ